MSHLIKKGSLLRFHGGITKLALVSFIVAVAAAFIDTIWIVFVKQFIQNDAYIGFFSGVLTCISLVSLFLIIPIIERGHKERLYMLALFMVIVSYVAFSFVKSFYVFVIFSIVLTLAANLRISSFGILVRDNSKKKVLAKNEGIVYTFFNTGWFIGPLIAGFLALRFGNRGVFLIASLFVFMALVLFWQFGIKDGHVKKKADTNVLKNFIDFFRNKDRVIAYFLVGGISCWWVLIYLFMPLFIYDKGYNILWVSGFLFAAVVPNILFTYPAASLANRIGFKKIFFIGFMILGTATLLCFLSGNFYFILGALIFAGFGTAMVESTCESYFFDICRGNEPYRFYSAYNTTIDVGHLIAKFIPSLLLLFLPFKFVFLAFSIFMFSYMILSLFTEKIVEGKKK